MDYCNEKLSTTHLLYDDATSCDAPMRTIIILLLFYDDDDDGGGGGDGYI